MNKYYYPAVFQKEKNKGYTVVFPDLKGCITEGDNEKEAFDMAKDALSLYLDNNEESFDFKLPKPSTCEEIKKKYPNDLVMLIEGDPLEYLRKYHNKAVKKTLSIPEWLNDKAIKEDLNFSQLLKEALLNKLNLTE